MKFNYDSIVVPVYNKKNIQFNLMLHYFNFASRISCLISENFVLLIYPKGSLSSHFKREVQLDVNLWWVKCHIY